MINTIKFWLFLGLLLSSSLATAQQTLSLEECVSLALSNNLQVKISEAETRKTTQQISEARAALLPQIEGEYNYAYSPDLPPAFLPGFIVGQPERENVAAILGLRQTQFVGVSVSQQLYNPQIFSALKVVRTANDLTTLQVTQTKEEVAYNVSSVYFNLLTLYKSMDLLEINIKSFETTIKTTEILVRNDFAKKSDVNRLILAKKSLETQLLGLKVAENELLNALKLLTNSQEEIAIKTEVGKKEDINFDNSEEISQRTDLKLIESSITLKELERKSVQSEYMPVLVAFGGYFSYAFNNDLNPFDRVENKSFPVSQVGVSLKIPIFDGGQKQARIRQKSIELENLHYQQNLASNQAKNEISNAANKYNTNLQVLQKEEESIALAETTLEETKTNYKNGFASITDIINAENDLQKTQTDYLTALINVRLAALDWKKANGTLLNF